ncbi:MAG: hypothetical protein ACRDZW_10510, partial [Acidimicrobiales bacterium]
VVATDGTWSLAGVTGGRYRVRAWRAPDLAQVEPTLVFVGAQDKAPVVSKLERFAGPFPAPSVAPNPPVVGESAGLVVQVTQRSVDEGGVVRAIPIPGARVELTGAIFWQVRSANPTVTDASGRARWELACRSPGAQPLSAVVNGGESFPLALPACADPTPVVPVPLPGQPATTTVTTRPKEATATTTTTRPRVAPRSP